MSDGDLVLLPPDPSNPHPLGRHVWHDPRNRGYAAFPQTAPTPDRPDKYSLWHTKDVYDQGSENCTTDAAIGVCRTSPCRFKFPPDVWAKFDTEEERIAFYLWCQKFDPREWGMPHGGSASDTPYKGLRELGLISGWKWLFGVQECKQWVMYDGPFSSGTIWLKSMFEPAWRRTERGKPKGCYINVDRRSPNAGGHEIRHIGYSPGRRAFRVVQTWGPEWGDRGRAWIEEDDFDWLLQQQGDAVTVTP